MAKKKKPKPSGKCALCLEEKTFAKSHIISKFHTRRLYKSKSGIVAFDKNGKRRPRQGGYWEHLLCVECDNQLGKNSEDYAAKVLFHAPQELVTETKDGAVYKGIEESRFREYLLTTLWRMSISRLDFFSDVDLGSEWNEIIRVGLFNRKSPERSIPVNIVRVFDNIGEPFNAIVNPRMRRNKNDEPSVVQVLINGFLFDYQLDEISDSTDFSMLAEGTLSVANVYWWDIPWFKQGFDEALKLGGLDYLR